MGPAHGDCRTGNEGLDVVSEPVGRCPGWVTSRRSPHRSWGCRTSHQGRSDGSTEHPRSIPTSTERQPTAVFQHRTRNRGPTNLYIPRGAEGTDGRVLGHDTGPVGKEGEREGRGGQKEAHHPVRRQSRSCVYCAATCIKTTVSVRGKAWPRTAGTSEGEPQSLLEAGLDERHGVPGCACPLPFMTHYIPGGACPLHYLI